MSESKARKNRTQRFLEQHPYCYFCSGARPAVTVDHVPPRACFPDGFAPEGFESPACKACNQGTDKRDQIFGLYSMILDFDPAKFASEDDRRKISKLIHGIRNNYPEALSDLTKALPLDRYGSIITPAPYALSVKMTPAVQEAIEMSGAKLAHALYYRETKRFLTERHQFFAGMYQPQHAETADLAAAPRGVEAGQALHAQRSGHAAERVLRHRDSTYAEDEGLRGYGDTNEAL